MAVSLENNIFPDLSPRAELFEKVRLLEKDWLDEVALAYPDHVFRLFETFHFFRIRGIQSTFLEKENRLQPIHERSHFLSAL